MFDIVRAEVDSRMLAIRTFASHIEALESDGNPLAATCKGLAFVQLYASYEYTVYGSVQSMLSSIRNDAPEFRALHSQVLSLVLDSHFDAASNTGQRRRWETRIALLTEASSSNTTSRISDTTFPSDGSHYRVRQLQTIWDVFGVSEPVVASQKHKGRIDELVENRNTIAHGRRTADDVGRQYSRMDILYRIDDIDAICSHIITVLHSHYTKGGHLRPSDATAA